MSLKTADSKKMFETIILFLLASSCAADIYNVQSIMTNAQYTVLAQAVSNDIGSTGTQSNYTAILDILCVYGSFSNPVSNGKGLAGQQITVRNWGDPSPGCPPQHPGSDANGTQIYFIHVLNPVPGDDQSMAIFGVQDHCYGGIANTDANIQTVSNILQEHPSNAIPSQYMGKNCTLPVASVPSTSPSPPVIINGNFAYMNVDMPVTLFALITFTSAVFAFL